MREGDIMAKSVSKNTVKKSKTTKSKKISISLDTELLEQLENHLEQYGFSKEEYIKKAIREKLSRDKISVMIDNIIQ